MAVVETKVSETPVGDQNTRNHFETEGLIRRFDPEIELRTLRKFDRWLLPPLSVILLLAYLDRSNLGKLNLATINPVGMR